MPIFIREFTMSPDDPARLDVRPDHREYVRELFDAKSILMSGPLSTQMGAVMIYSAPNKKSALDLIAQDPYTKAGVVKEQSLREWEVIYPE